MDRDMDCYVKIIKTGNTPAHWQRAKGKMNRKAVRVEEQHHLCASRILTRPLDLI